MTYLTETDMKVGDTLFFCEVYNSRNDSGKVELMYNRKEAGVITKICPKRVYFTPSSDEKRFQKGYVNGSSHAEVVLPQSEADRLPFLHITYYASSSENLEKHAVCAANMLRERVRRKVRRAAKELKQLMKPVSGIEAPMNERTVAHRDPLPCAPRKEMQQQQDIRLTLSDGTILRASPTDDPLYPGLSISIAHEGGAADERLCFAELNRDRNNRLYIGAYNAGTDDCVYYKPYYPDTGGEEDE